VLFLVFDLFLNFGEGLVRYPVALLLGIVLHSYLNEGTSQAVRSLVTRESIVRKVEFPRLAVPLASVLAATFSLALNLVPIFVFLAILGGRPSWSWLQLPLLLGWLAVLVAGLAMLLSATYVRFRDVEPIWDVTLQVLFYATPIFWTINNLEGKPDWLQTLVFCNPLAAILQQARHAVVDESYDPAGTAIGTPLLLLIPIGITLLLVLVGYRTFAKQAPRVAEDL
jgi:ABC-2 type transport system permease protein